MARPLKKVIDERLKQFHALRQPGRVYTLAEIAAACGCTRQAVQFMERTALHHAREIMRRKLDLSYTQFTQTSASAL
jgi:hypothetical protein